MSTTGLLQPTAIDERIRRSHGRPGRDCVANTRVTKTELGELEEASRRAGKALSEWGREVMLEAARLQQSETMLLTELTALRLLMSTVLRSVALGETMTPEAYQQILTEVKSRKHETARDILAQYQTTQSLGA